jgi:diguanylate cyclase (GGDEF)-like protein
VRGIRPERFSDPLSAAQPDAAGRAREHLRLAGALLFGAGAVTLGAVLAAPDPDPSDHTALGVCALVYAAVALCWFLWNKPPALALHAICPLGTIAATAGLAFAEPIGLTPIFYLWPMLVAAYFLRREEVAANFAFAAAACAVALVLWVDPVLRLASFIAVLAIVGVVSTIIVVLREQVLAHVLRLREEASHDSLTGALNRGAFEERLEGEMIRARRAIAPLAIVVFDLDHFKRINDSFGHAAGDSVLRGVGELIARSKRRSDAFGRIGGEEFALMLPDTDMAGAAVLCDKLRARVAKIATGGEPLTVSFGIAEAEDGRDARTMLEQADRALYAAKRAGRDRAVREDEMERPAPIARPAAPWATA